jgi:prolyl-tRNA synthetase
MKPRFGLIRGREFIMKDLYTFDSDEENSRKTYDLVNSTYASFFDYLGVKWVKGQLKVAQI